ncbi:MAG: tyrosine-type recombinase/integrase [Thermodesulfobacteriota bacterium]|nr:tyrosine-type recombinase/integrase [Thermodesulfobacteriota bacterium]
MKGSISYERDRKRWVVVWYYEGKDYKVRRYKGEFLWHRTIAEKCLALIQGRWEDHLQGKCQFRIEEFTGKGWTDVIEFYETWLKEVVKGSTKPATYKCYRSYLTNWIQPFFEKNPVRLHEIQLDTLVKLKNSITLQPKGKFNVMNAFHAMMDYGWRSKRIPEMPPFPKKSEYGLKDPEWSWYTREQRDMVLNAIPQEHKPIFDFLVKHYRRPGEACAMFKTDYDAINDAFWIRRTISDRKLTETTKTGKAHYTPCDSDFTATARRLLNENLDSPFLFVNPRSRKKNEGGRYTLESLNTVWKKACDEAGVPRISLYHGTKHTACTLFVEEGGGPDELQILTDHARRESVERYYKITLNRKRRIMNRSKVISLYPKAIPGPSEE